MISIWLCLFFKKNCLTCNMLISWFWGLHIWRHLNFVIFKKCCILSYFKFTFFSEMIFFSAILYKKVHDLSKRILKVTHFQQPRCTNRFQKLLSRLLVDIHAFKGNFTIHFSLKFLLVYKKLNLFFLDIFLDIFLIYHFILASCYVGETDFSCHFNFAFYLKS